MIDLARYAALKRAIRAHPHPGSTTAATAQNSSKRKVRVLEEAFEFFTPPARPSGEQIEQGREPNDQIDPNEIDPLTRRYLRDAFREVAAVQKSFASNLGSR